MDVRFNIQRSSTAHPPRQVENEGILRMILLAFALTVPMASMAYLKIQHTRLSYEMSELRGQLRQEEEFHRTLLLRRSYFERSEEIKAFADRNGMVPRKGL